MLSDGQEMLSGMYKKVCCAPKTVSGAYEKVYFFLQCPFRGSVAMGVKK